MIPGILRLNSKVKYGITSRNVPIYLFDPLDRNYSSCIVGCSEKDVTSNVLALINVERWEPDTLTRGTLVRIIGKCGDSEAESEAIFYQYGGPTWKKFNKTTLVEPPYDHYERIHGYTFNVDPLGCQDIDDVVTIGFDGYIYITIADVASWMHYNRNIFETAARIGQTLYKDGRVVAPLLPIEEECSLLPGELRRGFALKFKFDGVQIGDISFQKVQLVNNWSYTYSSIYDSDYASPLKKLASTLAGREVTDSHEWVEQLMMFYNQEAAKLLMEYHAGLLRTQDGPDVERLKEYGSLGADVEFLANKSAYYVHASTKQTHWGIGGDHYCHATSPIRRFADIVNQMVLSGYSLYRYDIATLNERSSFSKKYERDMFFLFQVLNSGYRSVEGMCLNDHRIWVPNWKRVITCNTDAPPGTRGVLRYSVDMDQPTWKKRMVFRFDT